MKGLRIVPANNERDRVMLRRAQELCLPGDNPLNPGLYWWWVARVAGELAGFCALGAEEDGDGYLARAGVLPEFRGQGLQKRLIKVREEFAREHGMSVLICDTCDNPPSANSLIACGFKMFQPQEPWGLPRSVYWRKSLRTT